MSTPALVRRNLSFPLFDDFFKPWNEWYGESGLPALNVPAVNILEDENEYIVTLAVPGLKKSDFKIDVDGTMLTIRCEKEESKDEKNRKFTRREYNYASFSRTFSLPDEVNKEKIDASYDDGVLKLVLPRNENQKKSHTKQISVK